MDFFVRARSIKDWADSLDARSMFPHVVRRLVAATASGISEIDFPAYESAQRRGFDGVVECTGGNAWVPTGRSGWELSTEKDRHGQFKVAKANDDFDKRTDRTPPEEQERTVYVCLTPRQFNGKRDWAREKLNAETNFWMGVRAYDADDLEQWAEAAPPGVIAWFGRQIGARPRGVDDVAHHWSAISKTASCELLPSVFLAGRDQSVERVRRWLAAEADRLAIECRSPAEVLDFFCAVVETMNGEDRVAIESRAIIIHDLEAWTTLRDATVPAVLVVDPSLPLSNEEIWRAVANRHHVLVASEPTIFTGQRDSGLERAREFDLAKALEECGYTPVKAEQFARAAGGSLAILKQRLTAPGSKLVPRWASEITSEVITTCLLLGGWESNESDQLAFGLIAGREFAECESKLQRMASSPNPLLLHAAGNWRLISKDYAWSLFEERVASSALKAFESLAVEILADDDPRYLLPEDERLYANIKGHVPKYSETIKKHVAETLAFLGAFGSRLEAASSINIGASVDQIVALVLSPTCTWHRWASLGSRLPLLAEASPSSFLRAVREDLDRPHSEIVKLLNEEEEGPHFGRCNHAGLLWALEGLAWSREHLGVVVEFLLALSDRDAPEIRWSNRPKNSLGEILSYWIPHTTATVEERIQVLDLLIRHDRKAAWPILVSLLPSPTGGLSMPTHKPYWRDWADEWRRGATRAESIAFITATAERVIQQAGVDSVRWKAIFGQIGRFPYTVRKLLLETANTFSHGEIPDIERRAIADELSEQINRHRSVKDANWSLPPEMLDELEPILERLKPRSGALRNAWLFDQWPDRYFALGGNHGDNQAALDAARQIAIREILDSEGFAGIESLAEHVASPYHVGLTLAKTTKDEFLRRLIPAWLEGNHRDLEFIRGFIWNRYWPTNWGWVDDSLLLCESDNARGNLLEALPFSPDVWDRAESAGGTVSDIYWERCRAINPQLDAADVATAAQNLCEHKRPVAAIGLLSMALHNNLDLDAETLLSPLETLLTLPPEQAETQWHRMDGHQIQQIIGALQERGDVEDSRLIPIEWHFIRLLDERSKHAPRTLQHHLSSSPEFFNEVLSLCFRPRQESGEASSPETLEHKRHMAEHAFQLLHDWNHVPGTVDDGSIDEDLLKDWCIKARQIAEELGRLGVCDNYIGELFARSEQRDRDGAWPCLAIRRVAEEIASDSLGSGMSCGIHNLRGVCWRGSGGDQERELAAEFRKRADRIRFDSPFVARVLDSVVQSYEREAKWWDERDRWEE